VPEQIHRVTSPPDTLILKGHRDLDWRRRETIARRARSGCPLRVIMIIRIDGDPIVVRDGTEIV